MTTTHAIYELFEPLLGGVPVRILSDGDSPVFDDQSGPVAVFRLPRTQRPA
jgi:hypothetical protein